MKAKAFAALSLALLMAGCATEPILVPGRGVRVAYGTSTTAYDEQAGVRIFVDGASWNGSPVDLGSVLTPVRVIIENHSGRQLRVAYSDMSLSGGSGFTYSAIAPLPGQMRSTSSLLPDSQPEAKLQLADYHRAAPIRVPPPRIHYRRFYVAPHYHYWHPSAFVWVNPFPYSSLAYSRYSWPAQLPTADMIAEAMPEGVVQDDGQINGFVYFQGVARRESDVQFRMQLVDADTGVTFGAFAIPFGVRAP